MGGPEEGAASRRSRWLGSAALGWMLTALACATAAPREASLPAPLPPAPPRAEAPATAPGSAAPPAEQPPAAPPTVIVVEEGGGGAEPGGDLVAAARAERARRAAAAPPSVVLTDRNLKEFSRDQKLTEAVPPAREGATGPGAVPADPREEERYWRERGRSLRERWRRAAEDLAAERDRAAELRVRFYSTDDPFFRDGEIKPAWDRSLERIGEREREVEAIRGEVDHFLEEGRRAGALPAWLDDGIELEPPARREPSRVADPGEPTVVEEPPG